MTTDPVSANSGSSQPRASESTRKFTKKRSSRSAKKDCKRENTRRARQSESSSSRISTGPVNINDIPMRRALVEDNPNYDIQIIRRSRSRIMTTARYAAIVVAIMCIYVVLLVLTFTYFYDELERYLVRTSRLEPPARKYMQIARWIHSTSNKRQSEYIYSYKN